MRKLLRGISYRWRVSLVMVLFAVIPFSLFGIFYFTSERDKWEEDALGEYSQMLAVASEQFDRSVQEMELKALYVSNSADIRAALAKVDRMTLVQGLDFVDVLREMEASITADNEALTVRWYPYLGTRDYGAHCYTMESFLAEFQEGDSLREHILELESRELYVAVRQISRGDNNGGEPEDRICVYIKMGELNGSDCLLEMSIPVRRMLDVSGVQLPEGSMFGIYLRLQDMDQTFLLSREGQEAREVLEQYHETGQCPGYYAAAIRLDSLAGSQLTSLFPEAYVDGIIHSRIVEFFLMMLLFLLTILACSYGAATLLTARVTRSIEMMNSELGTFLAEPSASVIGDSDFLGIERRIRKLIQNTREYSVRLEQHKAEMNRMELELLQMRFNPHFLYNTLASIRYQIKDETIRKSIDSLIHYYRIVLSRGHLLIRIEEEIAMIHEYLELEIFAYRLEKVNYIFDIAKEVQSFTIIKHLLQPIVENALEHGVRGNEEGGIIWIRARLEENDIVFEIEDNGTGMTPDQIENVLKEPAGGSAGGGYGIYNVQQRIESHYGEGYGITFHSRPGEGTCVSLKIPKRDEQG